MEKCLSTIHKFTVPLFKIKAADQEPCTPMPLASGVFFYAQNRYFLFSAGHVFTGEDIKTIGVHLPDCFYVLNGILHYMKTDNLNETSNIKADIAIYELDEQTYNDISPYYAFVTFENLKIDYISNADSMCIVMGYPASKCNTWYKGGKQTSQIWGLESTFILDSEVFNKLGKDTFTNYLIECHFRKLQNPDTGQRVAAAKPEGLSGCGLWIFVEGVPRLIGIMNGYDKIESVLVATKIDFYTEFLRQKLGLEIEESCMVIDY